MMLRILQDKFIRLGRDEDGVALVTTLAVFMFMYLICMGVYAIGTAVKTRIHLQNACDAAAYSAAVVQADTLSRIATLNRAMAWTYIAMSRRQMDYIVDKWLGHTLEHYREDKGAAIQWYLSGTPCCFWKGRHSWKHGFGPSITLNNHWRTSEIGITSARTGYTGHLGGQYANGSFYAGRNMESQITQDKQTIKEINRAIRDLIRGRNGMKSLRGRIKDSVYDVLDANLSADLRNRCRSPFLKQNDDPLSVGSGYLRVLQNIDGDEDRFAKFVNQNGMVAALGNGSRRSQWFVRGNGSFSTEGQDGLQRSYRHWTLGNLQSSWTWNSFRWICTDPKYHSSGYLQGIRRCQHVHDGVRCRCRGGGGTFNASVYGDNNRIWNDYYIGERAEPYVLTKDYFGDRGTITVGLACENQNPWTPILGTAIRGIFSAFNYGGELPLTPQYTVCLASAKAGWKETLNWSNAEGVENDRAYRVDWEDGNWNLCQSDLDAVLIPVRRAETLAEGRRWNRDVGDFLADYVEGYNGLGVSRNRMRAGGSKRITLAQWRDDRGSNLPPDYYRFDRWRGLPVGRTWDWERGNVTTEWQIGNKSRPIDWDGLQKVMFH